MNAQPVSAFRSKNKKSMFDESDEEDTPTPSKQPNNPQTPNSSSNNAIKISTDKVWLPEDSTKVKTPELDIPKPKIKGSSLFANLPEEDSNSKPFGTDLFGTLGGSASDAFGSAVANTSSKSGNPFDEDDADALLGELDDLFGS